MRKFFYWNQSNSHVAIETSKQPWYGFGMTIGDHDRELHFWLGFYFQFYLTIQANWTRKLSKIIETEFKIMFNSSPASLSYSFFTNPDMNTPWSWRNNYIDLVRFFLGNPKYSEEVTDIGTTQIDLPEKSYETFYKVKNRYWKHPRWPFKKKHTGIEFEIPGGLPVPGKGENSWDCDDDAIFSISMPFEDSVREARNKVAIDILKTRQKRSNINWKPKI